MAIFDKFQILAGLSRAQKKQTSEFSEFSTNVFNNLSVPSIYSEVLDSGNISSSGNNIKKVKKPSVTSHFTRPKKPKNAKKQSQNGPMLPFWTQELAS